MTLIPMCRVNGNTDIPCNISAHVISVWLRSYESHRAAEIVFYDAVYASSICIPVGHVTDERVKIGCMIISQRVFPLNIFQSKERFDECSIVITAGYWL